MTRSNLHNRWVARQLPFLGLRHQLLVRLALEYQTNQGVHRRPLESALPAQDRVSNFFGISNRSEDISCAIGNRTYQVASPKSLPLHQIFRGCEELQRLNRKTCAWSDFEE